MLSLVRMPRGSALTWRDRFAYARFIEKEILPAVDRELSRWAKRAAAIPNPELRAQALASIGAKRFHCEGGSVYAVLRPDRLDEFIPLIVAFQTISDYLDNLCDRSTSSDGRDFRLLHTAMLDAVTPTWPTVHDYYALHPEKDDGGYLTSLVAECRSRLARLPGQHVIQEQVRRYVGLYNDLQVYKHILPERRLAALEAWFARHRPDYPDLYWWEFAAASGSTLGVFVLMVMAASPDLTPADVATLDRAYFPWIAGLHILLDYLIDQEEDRREGDLNLVSFYPSRRVLKKRLKWFFKRADDAAGKLHSAAFHRMVVHGLPGLYLTDEKVRRQHLHPIAWDLIRAGGIDTAFVYFWYLFKRPDRRPGSEKED